MRPNSESFAISQSTIPEILQVSFDNNVLSRGVKSSLQACRLSTKTLAASKIFARLFAIRKCSHRGVYARPEG